MSTTKKFSVTNSNWKHTKLDLTPEGSSKPAYLFDLAWLLNERKSKACHSIVMRAAGSGSSATDADAPIVGVCDLEFKSLSKPIHICFGDPDMSPNDAVWEDLVCRKVVTTNVFELNIDLGEGLGRKVFQWKRTHDVKDAGLIQRLDTLNFKMVEVETDAVLARFVHNPWYGSTKGTFEVEEFNGGPNWEKIVLLSGMSALEYSRKMTGLSW